MGRAASREAPRRSPPPRARSGPGAFEIARISSGMVGATPGTLKRGSSKPGSYAGTGPTRTYQRRPGRPPPPEQPRQSSKGADHRKVSAAAPGPTGQGGPPTPLRWLRPRSTRRSGCPGRPGGDRVTSSPCPCGEAIDGRVGTLVRHHARAVFARIDGHAERRGRQGHGVGEGPAGAGPVAERQRRKTGATSRGSICTIGRGVGTCGQDPGDYTAACAGAAPPRPEAPMSSAPRSRPCRCSPSTRGSRTGTARSARRPGGPAGGVGRGRIGLQEVTANLLERLGRPMGGAVRAPPGRRVRFEPRLRGRAARQAGAGPSASVAPFDSQMGRGLLVAELVGAWNSAPPREHAHPPPPAPRSKACAGHLQGADTAVLMGDFNFDEGTRTLAPRPLRRPVGGGTPHDPGYTCDEAANEMARRERR